MNGRMLGSGDTKPYVNCDIAKCFVSPEGERDWEGVVWELSCNLSVRLGKLNLEKSCLPEPLSKKAPHSFLT